MRPESQQPPHHTTRAMAVAPNLDSLNFFQRLIIGWIARLQGVQIKAGQTLTPPAQTVPLTPRQTKALARQKSMTRASELLQAFKAPPTK